MDHKYDLTGSFIVKKVEVSFSLPTENVNVNYLTKTLIKSGQIIHSQSSGAEGGQTGNGSGSVWMVMTCLIRTSENRNVINTMCYMLHLNSSHTLHSWCCTEPFHSTRFLQWTESN